jgi:predicted DNA-binding transcriptional regulator YafY
MARNAELVRQWETLRDIDAARTGIGVTRLAGMRGVHTRTIRRDLDALARAGFPLYDERVNGTAMWKLRQKPFRGLEDTGLSLTELCALYFSRSLLAVMAGAPMIDEAERALAKLERALPAGCRKYLDLLPATLKAKNTGGKKTDARRTRDIVARVQDATLTRRRVEMRYDSSSSRRTKDYVIEPLRLSYADGGMYVTAWVPEYGETRTFAVERIRSLALLDDRFVPRPLPPEPFADSLGVHTGTPEPIEIEFDARAAAFVKEREWHPSQEIVEGDDGSLLVRLRVCDDRPLRRWIHSFGPLARVVSPKRLAEEILADIDEARERYVPRLTFEMAKMTLGSDQPPLPLSARPRRAS